MSLRPSLVPELVEQEIWGYLPTSWAVAALIDNGHNKLNGIG
jgi:hypothetical protein